MSQASVSPLLSRVLDYAGSIPVRFRFNSYFNIELRALGNATFRRRPLLVRSARFGQRDHVSVA
jgi:hypothetical protein